MTSLESLIRFICKKSDRICAADFSNEVGLKLTTAWSAISKLKSSKLSNEYFNWTKDHKINYCILKPQYRSSDIKSIYNEIRDDLLGKTGSKKKGKHKTKKKYNKNNHNNVSNIVNDIVDNTIMSNIQKSNKPVLKSDFNVNIKVDGFVKVLFGIHRD